MPTSGEESKASGRSRRYSRRIQEGRRSAAGTVLYEPGRERPQGCPNVSSTIPGNGVFAWEGDTRMIGGDEGDRTLDLRIANATLSQLSYVPTANNYSAKQRRGWRPRCARPAPSRAC